MKRTISTMLLPAVLLCLAPH
uniref:Putative exported hydrolase n=1 Tax=mine drainage metagenome TaxID=410659 RepID=E6PDI1_9ZZZZ